MANLIKCINELRNGRYVIITDNESRENEGDIVIAGEFSTSEKIAFMIRYSGGILCVPCEKDRLKRLELPKMVQNSNDKFQTGFTISCDYNVGTTTGISAEDRSKTILAICDDNLDPKLLSRPGHVFPLQCHDEGLNKRQGHTESSIALLKIANLKPVSVISELTNDEGDVMRGEKLLKFSKKFNIPIITIKEIRKHLNINVEIN